MSYISNEAEWKYSDYVLNQNYKFDKTKILNTLSKSDIDEAYKTISTWSGYSPTPLIELDKLTNDLNLNNIYYKDESKRFNLKSFKALGGAYAVEKISNGNKKIVISTATAGNHGRSVAWGAQRLGLKCKIFISENVSKERGIAMQKLGAEVIIVKGNYENSLDECIRQSKKNNWQIVQDVAWKDYTQVPKLTMAGYSVMMKEISEQIKNINITHIFLQAGVGGMAAAMVAGIARYLSNIPCITVIEPESAACVMASIKTGKIEKINIEKESLMGGMSCGEVSLIPWEILNNSVKHCISLPDDDIAKTMKLLGKGSFSNKKIIAGENSAPGVISLIASCKSEIIKKNLNIDKNSNILLIGCEGDTDTEMYKRLINS